MTPKTPDPLTFSSWRHWSRAILAIFIGLASLRALVAQTDTGATAKPPTSSSERKLPPAFATRKLEIDVPFTVSEGSTPETKAARVDVLVSWDHGRNWHKYTEVRPDAGTFRFVAKRDMEFWFLTQTVDARGRGPRETDIKWPQLRLIVDTQKPDLRMTAIVNPTGIAELTWTISDATLRTDSFKIEYQDTDDPDETWHTVELSSQENVVTAAGLVGRKQLRLPAKCTRANVRAEVSDVAGNQSIFSQQLVLPSPQDLASAAQKREAQQRLADASARHWPTEDEATGDSESGDHQPGQRRTEIAGSPENEPSETEARNESEPKLVKNPFAGKGRLAALPGAPQESEFQPDVAGEYRPDEVEEMPAPRSSTPEQELPAPTDSQKSKTQRNSRNGIGPDGFSSEDRDQASNSFAPNEVPEPIAESVEPRGDREIGRPSESEANSIPAGDRPRLSSAKRFTLDYDVEAVGPEGIAEVELWGTNDGGRTWIQWGTDPDKASPMEVEVSGETVYGFRVVIVGKNGLVSNRPQSGDEADIWVEIDVTKPTARLTAAAYGSGEHAGELDIRWEAGDEHLAARPVTLSYSDRPDGKFTTIAAGLTNSGQYFWQFDPRSPRQLYLRLDVRDEAGNVSTDILADPISIEGLTPKARIRSLTPTAQPEPRSGKSPFRQPLFR